MATFEISGVYLTQGDAAEDVYEWGVPEEHLEAALSRVPGITVMLTGAGTVLTTGERDAQYQVETEQDDPGPLMAALAQLPPAEAALWVVSQRDDLDEL